MKKIKDKSINEAYWKYLIDVENKNLTKNHLKSILETFSTLFMFSIMIATLGVNIVIYSMVFAQLTNQLIGFLIVGNFILFGVICYIFLKNLEQV